jgi:hypothetical protein
MPFNYSQLVSTDICRSAVKRSPLATLSTAGADTAVTLKTIELAASFLNTATIVSSMPIRFEALSNIGTVIIILKLAIGEILAYELLPGAIYGSAGATHTLLANTVLGG